MKKILIISQAEMEGSMDDIIKMLPFKEYECSVKIASQLKNADYDDFDLLIGMEQYDLRDMYRICGGDFAGKMFLLTEFIDHEKVSSLSIP